MICLLDWARAQRGLKPLRVVYPLNRSSILKALAIKSCNDFSHTPCGKPFADTFDAVGYEGPVSTAYGENIAWGAGARQDRRASSSRAGSTRRTTGRTSSARTGRSRGSLCCPFPASLARRTSRSGSASSACKVAQAPAVRPSTGLLTAFSGRGHDQNAIPERLRRHVPCGATERPGLVFGEGRRRVPFCDEGEPHGVARRPRDGSVRHLGRRRGADPDPGARARPLHARRRAARHQQPADDGRRAACGRPGHRRRRGRRHAADRRAEAAAAHPAQVAAGAGRAAGAVARRPGARELPVFLRRPQGADPRRPGQVPLDASRRRRRPSAPADGAVEHPRDPAHRRRRRSGAASPASTARGSRSA